MTTLIWKYNKMQNDRVVKYILNDGEVIFYIPQDGVNIKDDPFNENVVWHYDGGPANICANGSIGWWLNNEDYELVREYCEHSCMSDEDKVIWMLKYGERLPEHVDDL